MKSYLKMPNRNHRVRIVDYYELLARRVDDYTDEQLKKYTNKQLIEIGDVEVLEKDVAANKTDDLKEFDLFTATDLLSHETEKKISSPYLVKDERPLCDFKANKMAWREEKKFHMQAHDFLNLMGDVMIEELEEAARETLEYYETIKDELNQDEKITYEEELKRKLFAKRSAIFITRPDSKLNPFTLYLVILDFYLDESLEKLLK